VNLLILNRGKSFELYASKIQDKTPQEVETYYKTFEKKWSTLASERYCVIFNVSLTIICRISSYHGSHH